MKKVFILAIAIIAVSALAGCSGKKESAGGTQTGNGGSVSPAAGQAATQAANGAPSLEFTLLNSGLDYEVSKGTVASGAVIIPGYYQGESVTYIPDRGFADTNITSVSGANIKRIGSGAFAGCESLTNAEFPLVTSIGAAAFLGCTNLASVTLGTVHSDDYGDPFFWFEEPFPGNLHDVYFAPGGGAGTYVTNNPGTNARWTKQGAGQTAAQTAGSSGQTVAINPFIGIWQGTSSGFSLDLTFNPNDTVVLYISGSFTSYAYDITDSGVARLWSEDGDLYATATVSGSALSFNVSGEMVSFTKVN